MIIDCIECREYYEVNFPALLHAFVSVGIERGKSTEEMASNFFKLHHVVWGHKNETQNEA